MKNLIRSMLLSLMVVTAPALAAENISPDQLAQQIEAGTAPLIIDVRTEEEYLNGHVPGARLIPHDKIGNYTESLSSHKDRPIVVYCRSDNRAQMAIDTLEKAGFKKVHLLKGSFQAWQQGDHKVAR